MRQSPSFVRPSLSPIPPCALPRPDPLGIYGNPFGDCSARDPPLLTLALPLASARSRQGGERREASRGGPGTKEQGQRNEEQGTRAMAKASSSETKEQGMRQAFRVSCMYVCLRPVRIRTEITRLRPERDERRALRAGVGRPSWCGSPQPPVSGVSMSHSSSEVLPASPYDADADAALL